MHIIFIKEYDNYKAGSDHSKIERTLARRFCEMGVAEPMKVHLDRIAEDKALEKIRARDEADKATKAAELKAEAAKKSESAESVKATTRSTQTKNRKRGDKK